MNKTKDIFSQPFFLIGLSFMVIGIASSTAFVAIGIIFMALGYNESTEQAKTDGPKKNDTQETKHTV